MDYIPVPLMTENIEEISHLSITYYNSHGLHPERVFSLKRSRSSPCLANIALICLSKVYYFVKVIFFLMSISFKVARLKPQPSLYRFLNLTLS